MEEMDMNNVKLRHNSLSSSFTAVENISLIRKNILNTEVNKLNTVKNHSSRSQCGDADMKVLVSDMYKEEATQEQGQYFEKDIKLSSVEKQNQDDLLEQNEGIIQPNKVLMLKDGRKTNPNNDQENTREVKNENLGSSTAILCRICYEPENEEKGLLLNPCRCTGSCQFIHDLCLKKWIENNILNSKVKAVCEICKFQYKMKFFMKYKFTKQKLWIKLKSQACLLFVSSMILTIVFTVIFVVVSSLSFVSASSKVSLIQILAGVAAGILLGIIIYSCRNCKIAISEPYLSEWKIFNVDSSEIKEMESEHQEDNPVIIHRFIGQRDLIAEQQEQPLNYQSYPYIQSANQVVMLNN